MARLIASQKSDCDPFHDATDLPRQQTTTATHSQTPAAMTHPPLSLLGLPTELRIKIYELIDTIEHKTVHLNGSCDTIICFSFQTPQIALLGVRRQMRNDFFSVFDRLVIEDTLTGVVTANDDNGAGYIARVAAVLMALDTEEDLASDEDFDDEEDDLDSDSDLTE